MSKFDDYGDDEGIVKWADEQQQYAASISKGDSLRNAKLIIDYAENLKALLLKRPRESLSDVANARREILAEMTAQGEKPGAPVPMDKLKADAEKQAYREARPEIVELVAEIEALRAQMQGKKQPSAAQR